MEISQTAATAIAATPPADPAPQIPLTSDFNTFLNLLTAQVRNQDPLNPVSSDDFATQLATFSGVEQQVRSNALLQGIADRLGSGDVAGLAGWIGLELRAPAAARFDGTPVQVLPRLPEGAESGQLLVRDADGRTVQRLPLAPGAESLLWPGLDAAGNPLPPGLYSFEVEGLRGGEVIAVRPVEIYATVREVRLVDGRPELVLEGGETLTPENVAALRQPG